jgi:hypothetical protein
LLAAVVPAATPVAFALTFALALALAPALSVDLLTSCAVAAAPALVLALGSVVGCQCQTAGKNGPAEETEKAAPGGAAAQVAGDFVELRGLHREPLRGVVSAPSGPLIGCSYPGGRKGAEWFGAARAGCATRHT